VARYLIGPLRGDKARVSAEREVRLGIVVSHNRYFLNRVCTDTMAFEGEGVVTLNAGNYDYYREKKSARSIPASRAAAGKSPEAAAPRRTERARKLSYKETRELETIEAAIHAAEEEVTRLETAFADPDFYDKHGHEWEALEAKLAHDKERVTQLYARWEELEAIKGAAI